jgi:hypothetical protein
MLNYAAIKNQIFTKKGKSLLAIRDAICCTHIMSAQFERGVGMHVRTLVFFLVSLSLCTHVGAVQFYTISEKKPFQSELAQKDPSEGLNSPFDIMAISAASFKQAMSDVAVNLLNWVGHDEALPKPLEPYSRRQHYGSWIRGLQDGKCYNTRARVLIRDSKQTVSFREDSPCTVDSGVWFDQYSGQWIYQASELQIDHLIPVKVSYELGGFKWSYQKRCMYFNYLEAPEHLIPMGNSENAKKGARSPDKYMPLYKPFWCSYLKKWLRVKMIWDLPLLPEEAAGIQGAMKEGQCNLQEFQMTSAELNRYRAKIFDQSHSCNRLRTFKSTEPTTTPIQEVTLFEKDEYLDL